MDLDVKRQHLIRKAAEQPGAIDRDTRVLAIIFAAGFPVSFSQQPVDFRPPLATFEHEIRKQLGLSNTFSSRDSR